MNEKLTTAILELMSVLDEDQHPDAGGEPGGDRPKYDTHRLGEFIYSIQVGAAGECIHTDIHMQWPRLHRWIVEQQQAGVQLEWRPIALVPDDVHVRVNKQGSQIAYSAIIEQEVLLDMLLSSAKRDEILEQYSYAELSVRSAEDLWNMVIGYECL